MVTFADMMGGVPEYFGDDSVVLAWDYLIFVHSLACIEGIAQHPGDGVLGKVATSAGTVAGFVEQIGNILVRVLACGVPFKGQADRLGFFFHDDGRSLGIAVVLVAVVGDGGAVQAIVGTWAFRFGAATVEDIVVVLAKVGDEIKWWVVCGSGEIELGFLYRGKADIVLAQCFKGGEGVIDGVREGGQGIDEDYVKGVFLDSGEEILEARAVVAVGVHELGDDGPSSLDCKVAH
jgi:hypothetical protein